jgi:hypothetical protein
LKSTCQEVLERDFSSLFFRFRWAFILLAKRRIHLPSCPILHHQFGCMMTSWWRQKKKWSSKSNGLCYGQNMKLNIGNVWDFPSWKLALLTFSHLNLLFVRISSTSVFRCSLKCWLRYINHSLLREKNISHLDCLRIRTSQKILVY